MASPFGKTIAIDNIAEATSSAGVTVENTLKVNTIADGGSGTITLTSDCQFDGDVTVGSPIDPQTIVVYRDLFADRQIFAPNMISGKKFMVYYSDLSASGTTETYSFPNFSHDWMPYKAYTRVLQLFDAPGLSAMSWTVGWGAGIDAADPDGLLLTGDSDGTATGTYQMLAAHKGVALNGSADYLIRSSNEVTVSFTTTGANINTLTQGILQVVVFFAFEPQVF